MSREEDGCKLKIDLQYRPVYNRKMVENIKTPPLEQTANLPPEDASLIYSLLNRTPSEVGIKRITSGKTNKNFKVQYDGSIYVVRLPKKTDNINRGTELSNIHALLENPTTSKAIPKFIFYVYEGRNALIKDNRTFEDVPDGTAVTQYLEGFDLTTDALKDDAVRKALVRTLHAFHTSGVKFTNSYDPFVDEIGKYKRRVEESSTPITLVDERLVEKIDSMAEELTVKLPEEPPVATHNDLVLANLRMGRDGEVRLLDFEYAGFNNRGLHYDYGTLFGENVFADNPMTKDIFEKILEQASRTYGAKFDPEKAYREAFVNMIVTFWWGLVKHLQASDEKERQYFSQYVRERAEKIMSIDTI